MSNLAVREKPKKLNYMVLEIKDKRIQALEKENRKLKLTLNSIEAIILNFKAKRGR